MEQSHSHINQLSLKRRKEQSAQHNAGQIEVKLPNKSFVIKFRTVRGPPDSTPTSGRSLLCVILMPPDFETNRNHTQPARKIENFRARYFGSRSSDGIFFDEKSG